MASLSTTTLSSKLYLSQRCRLCSPARKLDSFLQLPPSHPLPRLLICYAAKKTPRSERPTASSEPGTVLVDPVEVEDEDDYVRPQLPGDEPDFWEGPQWNALGFIVQYMWAFGIIVALIGCGIAVRTYNVGATDFKNTSVFKEAVEAQGVFEEPADSQAFEESSKEAPSVQENSN